MNQRFLSVLVFAFVVAAGASFLLYRLMANRVATKAAPATAQVIVAARNLELGVVLQDADLKAGEWAGTLPSGASSNKADFIGRGVISMTYANEPILNTRLAPKGAGGGLAAMIPPGMRAVAVRVNEVVGVAGFVNPGSRVDILVSGSPPSGAGNLGSRTKTLLQNIEVMSAGHDFKKDSEGKPVQVQVVNLLVTPEQAEASQPGLQPDHHPTGAAQPARHAGRQDQRHGHGAHFRGRPVRRTATAEGTGAGAKPAAPAPVVVKPQPPAPFVMEIIQGGKRVQTQFSGAEAR